ncbi:glycosyltransferase [Vibrio vulnificus]|uniref:glycosyltransferase n=1 Tax=Vibrio vulnificus TaxID=672 RepID=UPI0019D491CF|nr:glycosyltransferase [Vibrio vulnificus]MBN8034087.1 glycosyltransferase [Vibrio vulnificus]
MKRLLILVVLYNTKVNESETLNCIEKQKLSDGDFEVIVWDNSPNNFSQEGEKSLPANYQYFRSERNESLSKIYNIAVEKATHNNFDYLCLLDQDTTISSSFFQTILDSAIDGVLSVPIIKSIRSGEVVSPRYEPKIKNIFNKGLCYPLTQTGQQNSKRFFAIGSGFILDRILLNKRIRFDEETHIYGVDKEFCLDYQSEISIFNIIDEVVLHDVSHEGEMSPSRRKWQFKQIMDYRLYQYKKHSALPLILPIISLEFRKLIFLFGEKFTR